MPYYPFTPAGSMCAHLESDTEAEAWEKLLEDAAHMPYDGKKGFQDRGYTVEFIPNCKPRHDHKKL